MGVREAMKGKAATVEEMVAGVNAAGMVAPWVAPEKAEVRVAVVKVAVTAAAVTAAAVMEAVATAVVAVAVVATKKVKAVGVWEAVRVEVSAVAAKEAGTGMEE